VTEPIRSVRVFAGTIQSAAPQFQGLRAPATLTLIEHNRDFECRFVFFVGTALPLTVRAPKSGATTLDGTACDPRGWDVSFAAELRGDRVEGTFVQPHDRGDFELEEV
jgi:hypothetical protein